MPETSFLQKVQESFLQNVIFGLILVGYFASHVMCRKLASYKSAGNFPTNCFLGINLNTTVSILNMCRKFSYKMQENFLHMSASAGKFPTHKCKMLHKCRKISCTYSKNLDFLVKCRKHVSYTSTSKYRCT